MRSRLKNRRESVQLGRQGNRSGCGRWIVGGISLVVFFFLFRYEFGLLWNLLKSVPDFITRQPFEGLPPTPDLLRQLSFIGLNIIGAILLAILIVILVAQSVLPVRTNQDKQRAVERFYGFLIGRRAPLIVIREGGLLKELPPKANVGGGVALVDLNSVIVLEKPWASVTTSTVSSTNNFSQEVVSIYPMARVGRPGLVFIHPGERLRGVVSLRKQSRANIDVLAHTSDGIEVKTNIDVRFTLGQPAEVIIVAYYGEDDIAESFRVLHLDPKTRKIRLISDDLDEQDKTEIHCYAQQFLTGFEPDMMLEPGGNSREYPPFYIDDRRILSTIYSQARDVSESRLDHWTDLPSQVATEIFRNMISQVDYDSLYLPKIPQRFPLQSEFKPNFDWRVRLMGVMSYQFVRRHDEQLPIEGQRVDHRQFRISEVQELRAPKILRDRGIKILHAGFSELVPTDPTIKQQRLDSWRAYWEQRADIIKADHDREVIRIRNLARVNREREMITKLSHILENSAYSEEALTLRVFQALEQAASDPYTRQLLPRDTINLLRSLRLWLLPDENAPPTLFEEKEPNE